MPGGRRRRRVPWFSFIPLLQLNDNNSTATTVQPQQQFKGKTINTRASALDFDGNLNNLNNFFPTTDLSDHYGHPRATDA